MCACKRLVNYMYAYTMLYIYICLHVYIYINCMCIYIYMYMYNCIHTYDMVYARPYEKLMVFYLKF